MRERVYSALSRINQCIVIAALTIGVLWFLPVTQNFYDTNKGVLFVICSLFVLILWSIRSAITRMVTLTFPSALLAIVLLAGAGVLSVIVSSTNKWEALTYTVGPIPLIAIAVMLLLTDFSSEKMRSILKWASIGLGSILALSAIYTSFGIAKLMFPDITFLSDPIWSPVGSSLVTLAVLAILFPLAIDECLSSIKEKKEAGIAFSAVSVAIMGVALPSLIWHILPKFSSIHLPYGVSWSIMLEMFKNPVYALTGVGIENFLPAFTAARPASMNLSPIWNIRFTTSANTLFHIGTTEGIVGLAALAIVGFILFRGIMKETVAMRVVICMTALALILVPIHIALFSLLAIILLLKKHSKIIKADGAIPEHIGWVSFAVGILGLVVVGIGGYFTLRYYIGELTYYQSLKALQAKDGTKTYNLQIRALQLNPMMSAYHLTYSQTNYALSEALAANANKSGSPSAALTEDDRKLISQLLQQAIREVKIATNLNPLNVSGWETLARLYRSIMTIVTGADGWAVAAYQQAIQRDPTNPLLRMELAGIYINQQNFTTAARELETAALLKPDLPNIHYNLAYVWRQLKIPLKEAVSLKQTLLLLPEDSSGDRQGVQTQLDAVMKTLPADEQKAVNDMKSGTSQFAEPLSPLSGEATPIIKPKLELPSSASPSMETQTQPTEISSPSPTTPPTQ